MKKVLILLMVITTMLTGNRLMAQVSKTEAFKVYGNCEVCKRRIEKAAAANGVTKAYWDVNTKMMTVTYDTLGTTLSDIRRRIVTAGHDTKTEKAPEAAYNKLPGCCRYARGVE